MGLSITLSGWCIPSSLVIGCSDLLLSIVISLVPLLLANIGSWVDGLYFLFTNYPLHTTGLLLLFSIRVPAADFS